MLGMSGGPGSWPLPAHAYAALVDRLRAAGCVFAEDEARLLSRTARDAAELAAMTEQRVAGAPLEHVVGWVEFRGLRLTVAPGVFVPRRRTEFLVDQAVRWTAPRAVVVDLCCGCGAVGAAITHAVADVELHAVDIDPVAVRCARRNLGAGYVYQGDLYQPLPARLRGGVDVLVANAPYVPEGERRLLPREARDHEPSHALFGGSDGLAVARRVAAEAGQWLAPGGRLLIETHERQAPHLARSIQRHGLRTGSVTSPDLTSTVVWAIAPAS